MKHIQHQLGAKSQSDPFSSAWSGLVCFRQFQSRSLNPSLNPYLNSLGPFRRPRAPWLETRQPVQVLRQADQADFQALLMAPPAG
jgi:hypothetical protein